MDFPPELTAQVVSNLSTVDLGNLAMTCRKMRDGLDPILAGRLKRLIWANPNVVQLVRPEQPEAYGLTPRDKQACGNPPEIEPLAVQDNLRQFTDELYACPMLAKYVKHVFIDYRKLNLGVLGNDDFLETEDEDHEGQSILYSKLEEPADLKYPSKFWMSTCGLAAMVLLRLTNVESLVLLGCNTNSFKDRRDPITATLSVALTPGYQQKRLRSLRSIYAWGCSGSYGFGWAPWDLAFLPSVKTLECQAVGAPVPDGAGRYDVHHDFVRPYNTKFDRVSRLETLILRQTSLSLKSYFRILRYTPCLKRLRYQRISFPKQGRDCHGGGGLHLAKLRTAIQPLSDCLEELTIEVDALQRLWNFSPGGIDFDFFDNESDEEDGLYSDIVNEDDSEDEDDSDDEENSENEEMDWTTELDSLNLTQELKQVQQQYGPSYTPFTAQGIQNIPDVPIEDIQASLDRPWPPERLLEPSWDDQQPEFLGSLAHFTKLRTVAVPAIALQDLSPYPRHSRNKAATVYSDGTASGARKHLKDLLPRTLERLTLFKLEGTCYT